MANIVHNSIYVVKCSEMIVRFGSNLWGKYIKTWNESFYILWKEHGTFGGENNEERKKYKILSHGLSWAVDWSTEWQEVSKYLGDGDTPVWLSITCDEYGGSPY